MWIFYFTQCENTSNLCCSFNLKNSWENWVSRKMSLEHWFIHRYVFHTNNVFFTNFHHFIYQQERVTVWKHFLDIVDIVQRFSIQLEIFSSLRLLFDLLFQHFRKTCIS